MNDSKDTTYFLGSRLTLITRIIWGVGRSKFEPTMVRYNGDKYIVLLEETEEKCLSVT